MLGKEDGRWVIWPGAQASMRMGAFKRKSEDLTYDDFTHV